MLMQTTEQRPSGNLWKRHFRMLRVFSDKRLRIKDNRDNRLVKRQRRDPYLPWCIQESFAYYKHGLSVEIYPKGYPRTSAYIDSDSETPLFRRFGILHARSLLYKEVELTELEAQLNELDKEDEGQLGADENKCLWRLGHSISLEGGHGNEKRRDLMKQIDENMEQYGILLLYRAFGF
jgi:hypothetical protein